MRKLRIDNALISTPLIDIVKIVRNNVVNGKLRVITMRGSNIRVTCPFHSQGLEKNADADIYIGDNEEVEYGFFHCFACNTKASFYHFVASCFNISDDAAKQWLIENFSDQIIEQTFDLPLIDLNEGKNKKQNYLDESILNTFESFHPYMQKRRLPQKVINEFEVKYDPKCKCLVFPVRDEKGKLFMLTRRSVENKMFLIDKDKEKPLYLLYYILQHNIKQFIVCEGQIDCLTAWGYGFPAVATIGALSSHQIDLINKSGVQVLYSMFDNDTAGKKFTNDLRRKLRKDIILINVDIFQKDKKDINDLTRDEFYDCIERAEKS